MSTGLTWVGLPSRVIVITCVAVMVLVSHCWAIVIVGRRAVVVIRVIVACVLVNVQRRRQGRRGDQGLNEHGCDEAAHGKSLLRPAERLSRALESSNERTISSASTGFAMCQSNPAASAIFRSKVTEASAMWHRCKTMCEGDC